MHIIILVLFRSQFDLAIWTHFLNYLYIIFLDAWHFCLTVTVVISFFCSVLIASQKWDLWSSLACSIWTCLLCWHISFLKKEIRHMCLVLLTGAVNKLRMQHIWRHKWLPLWIWNQDDKKQTLLLCRVSLKSMCDNVIDCWFTKNCW